MTATAATTDPSPAHPPPQRVRPPLGPPIRWAAAFAFAVALAAAFFAADVLHPPALFPKYLAAVAAPPAVAAERALDYSPLYLALARAARHLAADPDRFLFAVQGLLHGITAAAVAWAVALLAGGGWGLAAGLGAALYRPFLVYCGIEEPESLIVALLAVAILLALLARERLRADPKAPAGLPLALGAFAAVALAGIARPQHLALLLVWPAWIAAAAPPGGRPWIGRLWIGRLWIGAAAVAAVVVGPLLIARALATGVPTLMDPGAVFYEGNGPGATGLARFAPMALVELERAHPESADYGHVAYRTLAAWAVGREAASGLPSSAANRYWTGLALEGMAAWPGRAAARLARKAALALSPYEGHDLAPAEMLDRRLRPRLPTGFALLAVALPWLAFVRRERLAALAGPLAVALLAVAVQVVGYASARQRLPLALALAIVAPALAADLFSKDGRSRLRGSLSPGSGLLLGLCAALWLAQGGARYAVLDQLGWDRTLGAEAPSAGARLLAWEEGRALRPALARAARRFAAGVELARTGRAAASLAALAPLAAAGEDLTIDDKEIGVPAYWAARDLLALGDGARAARVAAAAAAVRPDDPRLAAFALRLADPAAFAAGAAGWRPPGVDPASARVDLARAAAAAGDRAQAVAILAPLGRTFPELLAEAAPARP